MKHTTAIIVSAILAASAQTQTPPELQAIHMEHTVQRTNYIASAVLYGDSSTNIWWGIANLASAQNGDQICGTVGSVTVTTNTTQHSNAAGCPMHGRITFGGMMLTSNPPQYLQDPGHTHPPGAPCYPHIPATERWTITEVVKSGIVLVLGESFPFRVVVSRTTNDHQRLSQEWKPANP